MKFLKYAGVSILAIAFFVAIGIIGRVEHEDRQYKSGEIVQEQMTTTEDLFKQIGVCAGVAVLGGLTYAAGAYIGAGKRWD